MSSPHAQIISTINKPWFEEHVKNAIETTFGNIWHISHDNVLDLYHISDDQIGDISTHYELRHWGNGERDNNEPFTFDDNEPCWFIGWNPNNLIIIIICKGKIYNI